MNLETKFAQLSEVMKIIQITFNELFVHKFIRGDSSYSQGGQIHQMYFLIIDNIDVKVYIEHTLSSDRFAMEVSFGGDCFSMSENNYSKDGSLVLVLVEKFIKQVFQDYFLNNIK